MTKNTKIIIAVAVVLLLGAALFVYTNRQKVIEKAFEPTDTNIPEANTTEKNTEEVVAENLKIPWEIAFLPDNSMLVTERTGTLKHITNGTSIQVQGVAHRGEGGLLGMALHPDFKNNQYIYLYSTTQTGNGLTNRVERYKFTNNSLTERQSIIENIPGASNHDGGRIAFDPDDLLYITTGDAEQTANAQNTQSLAGKILRLRDDGSVPSDNPFGNAVYSYGHRNPQGLAWDNQGNLWATEHGRSGIRSGFDELNRIEKGKNYGWPDIEGDTSRAGMEIPILHSGSSDTWAPSGLAFLRGHLIWSGLRGQSLYGATVDGTKATNLTTYLRAKYGRLRAVVPGPDGALYISTSNSDGRGTIKPGDDKIIKVQLDF